MIKTVMAIVLMLVSAWAFALDLNQASANDLQGLKGLGPKTVEQIVEARKNQSFSDWADFQARVKGIGPGKAAALSKQGMTISGKGFSKTDKGKATTAKPKAKETTSQ